jgi:8-oxo-dGTP pyrophosphatase MutT (NUDIX family)
MPISSYLRQLHDKLGGMPVLMPGVTAVILDDQRRVLLMRSRDDGRWYLPGGAMDPNEQPAQSIIREVHEETGLHVEPQRIIGVYSEPATRYPNGDVVLYVTITFACGVRAGTLHLNDGEATELRHFSADELPELPSSHRMAIEHAMREEKTADFVRA